MRRPASGKTSARSRRALRRKNTSVRSSSSSGTKTLNTETTARTEKTKQQSVASVLTLLREQLAKALAWNDAHADFERAAKVPVEARGRKPRGLPYSPWQLLEHLRLSQRDILEFCRN